MYILNSYINIFTLSSTTEEFDLCHLPDVPDEIVKSRSSAEECRRSLSLQVSKAYWTNTHVDTSIKQNKIVLSKADELASGQI